MNTLFQVESFTQKEYNDFILLEDRNLLGAGLRTSIVQPDATVLENANVYLFLGTEVMWENEVTNTQPESESSIVRTTNYLSLRWRIDDRVNISIVGYYQGHVRNLTDYRVLLQSSLEIGLTNFFSFRSGINYRFDNEPPMGIKKYDIELTNGLSWIF